MEPHRNVSETAIVTASLRALSTYETTKTLQCQDFMAELFLPADRKAALRSGFSRTTIKKAIPKGLYEYVIARTKYFDELFVDALNHNTDQIVFLGAGYDSRPYRFYERIGSTKIFELDTPSTQSQKISLLQQNQIPIHENLKYIPIDFEHDDLRQSLIRSGFDPTRVTLFLWEGVSFYLSYRTVTGMLGLLKEISGSGSLLAFDFQTIDNNKDLIDTGLSEERIQFGIETGKIDQFVRENGYSLIEHLTSNDMEERYLRLDNGELFGTIMPIMNFIQIEHS